MPNVTLFYDGAWPWALAFAIELLALAWLVRGLIRNGIL